MTRRTYLRVELKLDSPWRVGVWRAEAARDVKTARDPLAAGRPTIPTSAIMGSLVAAAKTLGHDLKLFGGRDASGVLVPSTWWALGVVLQDAGDIRERHQTPIDRHRRAAAQDGLHSSEVVDTPKSGSTLRLYLRADDADLDPLIQVLDAWRPSFGAGFSTGLGRAHVRSVRHRTLDLDDLDEVIAWLATNDSGPERVDRLLDEAGESATVEPSKTEPFLRVMFTSGPMEDREDLGRITRGTQWKGILRSRVEFIARSLGHPACMSDSQGGWTGCGHCDLCEAFGSADTGVGAWTFQDSAWGTEQDGVARQRIALDRFTGGTFSSALYPIKTVTDVKVDLIVTEERAVKEWVRKALLHAVHDIHDGLVAVGGLGAIGLGTLSAYEAWYQAPGEEELTELSWTALPAVHPEWQEASA